MAALVADVVIDVVLAVLLEIGVKRQAQHPFELSGRRFVTQVDEQLFPVRAGISAALGQPVDPAGFLFDDEKLAFGRRAGDDADGVIELHLLGMKTHEPRRFLDHRHLLGHSGPLRLAGRLTQGSQVRHQVGKLPGLDRLVDPRRHQRYLVRLLELDHPDRNTDQLALNIQQPNFLLVA